MDERLREQFELCRPGSDDLQRPEMAPLRQHLAGDGEARRRFEALQALDARLTDVFQEGPVPAGLQERLLASLRQQPADPPTAAAKPAPSGRLTRRGWLWIAGGAGVAASLAGVGLFLRPRREESPQRILDLAARLGADGWTDQPGELAAAVPPPAEFPISPAVDRRRPWRWQYVESLPGLQRGGVAYQWHLDDGARVTLLVTAFRGSPQQEDWASRTSPPPWPEPGSQALRMAAWHEPSVDSDGELLYVLVVDGGPRGPERAAQVYRSLLRSVVA